jgi:hypothetical protein
MADWDEKYFVTDLKANIVEAPWNPEFSDDEGTRLISMDNEVRKDSFYMETAWFWPGDWPSRKGPEGTVKEHSHPFDEAIGFVGSNPDDQYDLCGEVELWVDGRRNVLDRSFIAYIPAGTKHCPLKINRVDRPIFHFTAGMSREYNTQD